MPEIKVETRLLNTLTNAAKADGEMRNHFARWKIA